MVRLGAIFVGFCMVLIAASAGAVLYLYFAMTGAEAAIVALAVFTALAVYNSASSRLRDRGDLGSQIADLSRGTADLARQVLELGRRVAAVEAKTEAGIDKAVAVTRPLAAEIGELGTLIKQLAESVAAHDSALRGGAAMPVPLGQPPAPAPESAKTVDRAELGEPESSERATAGRFKGMERDAVVALLRDAVDAGRVDLHLQPIVTLPQRKVRYYEALARLRTRDGEALLPADFLPYADSAGLMPRIDNLMLFRCVQAVRRLLAKNREVGLFCNLSAATLADAEFFPQISEFMEANRALAPALVFELMQAASRALGPIESESLAAFADRGFRFSMDHVADLRFEPRSLAERGFRFVKVPASLLLNRNAASAADIHPADLSGLLSRYGIELVAEKIESESTVVDLLDYDVKFGQGFLFSPPRPVRQEVLGAGGETEAANPADARPGGARPPTPRASMLAELARGISGRS
jgi:cyclic-di-GMP phosphodiesterase TipF (flagellum assembly factor)